MSKKATTCKHPSLKKDCHYVTAFNSSITDFTGLVLLVDVLHQHSHDLLPMTAIAAVCFVSRFIVELL